MLTCEERALSCLRRNPAPSYRAAASPRKTGPMHCRIRATLSEPLRCQARPHTAVPPCSRDTSREPAPPHNCPRGDTTAPTPQHAPGDLQDHRQQTSAFESGPKYASSSAPTATDSKRDAPPNLTTKRWQRKTPAWSHSISITLGKHRSRQPTVKAELARRRNVSQHRQRDSRPPNPEHRGKLTTPRETARRAGSSESAQHTYKRLLRRRHRWLHNKLATKGVQNVEHARSSRKKSQSFT